MPLVVNFNYDGEPREIKTQGKILGLLFSDPVYFTVTLTRTNFTIAAPPTTTETPGTYSAELTFTLTATDKYEEATTTLHFINYSNSGYFIDYNRTSG